MRRSFKPVVSAAIVFTLLASSFQVFAAGINTWHPLNPLPSPESLDGIAYGDGAFVIAASTGTILRSTDGASWTSANVGTSNNLNSVTFAGGQFVAVGNNGAIVTSPDGLAWTTQSSGTMNQLLTVAYNNTIFLAAGANGTAVSSSDAVHWSVQNTGSSNTFTWSASVNGIFLLPSQTFVLDTYGSDSPTVLVSSNGINWSVNPLTNNMQILYASLPKVITKSGTFVAAEWFENAPDFVQSVHFLTSTDGKNWSLDTQLPVNANLGNIFSAHGNFFIESYYPPITVDYSTDLTDQVLTTWPNVAPNGFAYGAGVYVGIGSSSTLLSSSDGTNWITHYPPQSTARITSIASGSGITVAVGSEGPYAPNSVIGSPGPFLVSTNATSFDIEDTPANGLTSVAYGSNSFVAVGTTGYLSRSTNGVDWTVRPSGTLDNLADVCFGGGLWVAVGVNGTLITSTTGLTWTLRSSGTGEGLYGVTYGGGQFVAVGDEGGVFTSPDGINWAAQYVEGLDPLYKVTYGNGVFVATGGEGTIVTSPDGIDWTTQTGGTTNILYSVAYGDGQFLAVGSSSISPFQDSPSGSVIFSSTNGTSWQPLNSPTAWNLNAVNFANDRFYLGGGNGAILESDPLILPPGVAGGILPGNQGFQLSISGLTGKNIKIQSCSSMAAGTWSDMTTISNCQMMQTWVDISATNSSQRFYRVVAQ